MTMVDDDWVYYSTCDEDAESELTALAIEPTDHVVTVIGSGCRALSLLAAAPASIVCVDFSPGQAYLLELKLAAIRHLDYDTLLGFLGIEPCYRRETLLHDLRPHLSHDAFAYFSRHLGAVRRGVVHTGKHEQVYRKCLAPALRFRYGRHLSAMLTAPSLAEQVRVYDTHVNGLGWRALVRWGFSEFALRLLFKNAGYSITVDVDDVGDYVLSRLDRCVRTRQLSDNDWLSYMLFGTYPDRTLVPHYLSRHSYEAIRSAPTKIDVRVGDLANVLRTLPGQAFDKFSLSDVSSCITKQTFDLVLSEVARVAAPGAVVCYRNFLAKHGAEATLPFTRDTDLGEALTLKDRAFIYDIEVLIRASSTHTEGGSA